MSPRCDVPPLSPQISVQLQHALKMIVDPVEPQGDVKFKWDLNAWTKSAESFESPTSHGGGTEGPDCPELSPPHLDPQTAEAPGDAATELANGSSEATVTGVKRSHPSGAPAGPVLRKVPRVSLERLELDLAGAAQPPAFRVFPGTSAKDFSLIVIERGAQLRPPSPVTIKGLGTPPL
ncbi:hypothetical protein AV530_007083 [Patagioenas fasciata monilis]|uniref:Uncharacterized protein n=1 Tax=Patagioenas fasciata monilis TaxID=372326 RepID=A0A1V4JRG2_PATFA|nr:hypothetical protein AV530_007083 [Patagioenas fasciata monilis]